MSHEISATAASPGIAIAPLRHLRLAGEFIPSYHLAEEEIDAECERFGQACRKAADALEALKDKLGEAASSVLGIYDAHIALVMDPRLSQDVTERIRSERVNAEAALQAIVTRYEQIFSQIDNVTVRERAADVRDVGRQITGMLMLRAPGSGDLDSDEDYILAVDEFLPSDLGQIDTKKVRGIVMGEGGRYSHGAILAKSLGIPCVVGLEQELGKLPTGHPTILDAERGKLLVDPDEETVDRYRERLIAREEAEKRIFEVRLSPSVTVDGTAVAMLANIEGTRELEALEPGMFKGVGLFRTEFAFMERLMFPSEEEQHELYASIVEGMGGRNVTFRTLDIGGDKPLQYFRTPVERNPVLGWRGIRLTLQWRDIFYTQMRALIRASAKGPVSILLPMVTTLNEIRQAREILDEIVGDLRKDGVPVGDDLFFGVMIEVPAIAMMLRQVCEIVDFVSVGSNDLAQYLLAVDRDNPRVAGMYDPYHPGVLRFLADIVAIADETGTPCSLCGEIAGESDFLPLLLGMGWRRLSMTPVFLPRVKLTLRSLSIGDCVELWEEVRGLADAESVRERVRERSKAISNS